MFLIQLIIAETLPCKNMKKSLIEELPKIVAEGRKEVEEILECEYLVGPSPVDSECDFQACENCLDKHEKDHEYEGDCAKGDRHQEYEAEIDPC